MQMLMSRIRAAVQKYDMIDDGDRIAVGVSGGKDSFLLAMCMQLLCRHSDVPFTLKFIAIDPGYRTGCKVTMLDETGKLLAYGTIYPTEPKKDIAGAKKSLTALVKKYKANVFVIGNGTASRETESFVAELIGDLKEQGIAVIYISHRMEEIFELCDRITILRDGQYIDTKYIKDITMDDIVQMMIGREIGERYPKRDCAIGEEVFRVEGLSHEKYFKDVNFSVRAGEVLGVSGLMGAGRTEIMQAIFGNLPTTGGKLFIEGKEVTIRNPRQAIDAGIGFITEDRKTEGLLLEKSISENIEICNLGKVSNNGVLSAKKRGALVKRGIEEFRIKCFGPFHECNNLSGGNQQKVVLAKWIYKEPKILILDEPTRGVDIGAKKEIYSVINDLAAKGVAVILVSSELPEVLGMSDRIMVVHEGHVTGIIDAATADQEKVMTLATGGSL